MDRHGRHGTARHEHGRGETPSTGAGANHACLGVRVPAPLPCPSEARRFPRLFLASFFCFGSFFRSGVRKRPFLQGAFPLFGSVQRSQITKRRLDVRTYHLDAGVGLGWSRALYLEDGLSKKILRALDGWAAVALREPRGCRVRAQGGSGAHAPAPRFFLILFNLIFYK